MSVKGGEKITQDFASGEQEASVWLICTGCGHYDEGLSGMPSLNAMDVKENGGGKLQSQAKDEVMDNLNPEHVSAKLETVNFDCLVITEPSKPIAPDLNCGVEEVLRESLCCDDGDLGHGEGLSDMPCHNGADAKENGGEELQTEAKDEIRDSLHPRDVSGKLETANLDCMVIKEQKVCKEQDLASDSELTSNELVEMKDIKNPPQMEELDTPHDLISLCGKQITPLNDSGIEGVLGDNLFCVNGDLGGGEGLSDMPSHIRMNVEENGGEELESEAKDEIRDILDAEDVCAKLETVKSDSLVITEQKLHKEQDLPSGSQLNSNDGNINTQMQGGCDADNGEIAIHEEGHNRDVGSSSSLFGTLPCQALEDWSRNYTDEFSKGGEIFEAGHLPKSGGCQSDDAQARSNLDTDDHNSGAQDRDMALPHSTQAPDSIGADFSWGSLIGHGELVLNLHARCQEQVKIGHDTEASTRGDEIDNSYENTPLEGGSEQTDESFNGIETKEISVDFHTAFTAEDLSAHFTKLELQTDKEELQDDKQKGRLATRDNNELVYVISIMALIEISTSSRI